MIRTELKNIKKNGFFRFENNSNAREWRKGRRATCTKKTWAYSKGNAILVDKEKMIYIKLEYIKPSIAIDVCNLEFV